MPEFYRSLASPRTWVRPWGQAHLACSLEPCVGSKARWHNLWRRPIGAFVEGAYYCGPRCLEKALIDQMARLEALPAAPLPPHRIPLGLLMVARGKLTYEQVRTALTAQQSARCGKIGEWFEKLGYATEQEVTAALGVQWGCPVAGSFYPGVLDRLGPVPLAILDEFFMVPIRSQPAGHSLHLAFGERVDHAALYTIERILQCRTQPCVAGRKSVADQLERMRQNARPSEVEFGPKLDPVEMGRIGASYVTRLGTEHVRLGRLGNLIWLRLKNRGSITNLVFRLQQEPIGVRLAAPTRQVIPDKPTTASA